MNFTIGSEEDLSFALKILGQDEEIVTFKLNPQKKIEILGSQVKVSFYALRITNVSENAPGLSISGMLHIRVYPGMLNYGNRMTFEFFSNTKHMDIESTITIGSLWRDLSQTNVSDVWNKSDLSDEILEKAKKQQKALLEEWNYKTKKMSDDLNIPGKVIVSCSESPKLYDRGETRVMAYSGNPVKDFQSGELSDKIRNMANAVSSQIGKKFSLFRYQHHHLVWNAENPELLDKTEIGYMDQWLLAAKETSDSVMLDLQISPFIRAYKTFSNMGTKPLPEEGVPAFPWKKMFLGYVSTIRHAKQICPQLRIIQMPYEFDNISNNECHRDAHYQLFKTVYEAVNEINKSYTPSDQLKVAGLGVNTPDARWDFIDGFLQRFANDKNPAKRIDYLTWHTYLFPSVGYPNIAKGFNKKLTMLLAKHSLPLKLPVIVDEAGLAEPSTIEDLSDLLGASRKEAAMACFSAAIQDCYLKENGNFLPITGAGWHFATLTYGKQNVMSPYAKGMILRSQLASGMISSSASPQDNKGFGLYSFATKDVNDKISVLIWSASPAIFFKNAKPISYPKTQIIFNDLPESMQGLNLKVTIQSSTPDQEGIQRILGQDKCQTLPLTRGADRYNIDFTLAEIAELNRIPTEEFLMLAKNKTLTVPLNVTDYGMYLVTIEKSEK